MWMSFIGDEPTHRIKYCTRTHLVEEKAAQFEVKILCSTVIQNIQNVEIIRTDLY